jgi:hypothetical protein
MAVLSTIQTGYEYASSFGYNHPKVTVDFPEGFFPDNTGVPIDTPLTILVGPGHEWEEDVILHEYAHSIQYNLHGEWIP